LSPCLPCDTIRTMTTSRDRGDRALWLLVAATAICYAVGYPLALIGGSNVGWVFVTLGGPLLVAVVVLLIRRAQG
jgi:hypothetical protein